MDCLLCLERTNLIESVKVNSTLWIKENIKDLIERHLWPMENTQLDAYICISCWRSLEEFHKFYIRIKETHKNLIKTECESDKIPLDYIEAEVLIEPSISHKFMLEAKDIDNTTKCFVDKLEVEHKFDEMLEDPLNKNKRSKKIYKKSDIETKNLTENAKEALGNIDTKPENIKNKNHFLVYKKKRKNPNEKTGREYDQFIAKNFQIVCSICQVSLKDFITLRKHFREEHKKRGFVICCKKKIFSRPLLVDHIHTHLDPNYFQCTKCKKIYSERSTLESHIKCHETKQQGRKHSCETCGKSFVGQTQLENHKLTHAPDYEKKYSCAECGKFFTTSYSLNYHIQAIHHNKFLNVCDICGKTMRCRNQFKLHREKHDSKQKSAINCDVCGLRLTDIRGLRRHKKSQHPVGGKKEYHCHLCSKVSPNQEALRTHIRLTHSTNFNHKCTMCDKAFKRPYALREHMATHTGTALYTCPWCPKTFISNGNMHNHRKKSHPKEWEEAHRKRFSSKFLAEQTATEVKNIKAA